MDAGEPITAPSVWGCIEMDAAARNFDYAGYVNLHSRSDCKGSKLSPAGYQLVRKILSGSIEEFACTSLSTKNI